MSVRLDVLFDFPNAIGNWPLALELECACLHHEDQLPDHDCENHRDGPFDKASPIAREFCDATILPDVIRRLIGLIDLEFPAEEVSPVSGNFRAVRVFCLTVQLSGAVDSLLILEGHEGAAWFLKPVKRLLVLERVRYQLVIVSEFFPLALVDQFTTLH